MSVRLKPRTSTTVDLKRLDIVVAGKAVHYDIDQNAPTQRFICECCQNGQLYEAATVVALVDILKAGDTFVDVGAHVGFFSLIAAALVGPEGRVVAFEPDEANRTSLQQNVSINGFQHVACISAAVGERDGEVTFFENIDNDGGHALWDPAVHPFNEQCRTQRRSRTLPMTTLDSALSGLGLSSIKAIKIVTEGAELRVIQGATGVLTSAGVRLLVCANNEFGLNQLGTSHEELVRAIEKLGFAVCVAGDRGRFEKIGGLVSGPRQVVGNLFCFKKEPSEFRLKPKHVERLQNFLDRLRRDLYPEKPTDLHTKITRQMLDHVCQRADLRPGARVLDIGCGQGVALELFQAKGFRPTGITLGLSDLEACRQKGFHVEQMDQSFLEFEDGQFDFVWCRHCLEHSIFPFFTLSEIHRVLVPKGYLYVEVPAPDTSCNHQANKNHYSVLTRSMWAELLRRSGFGLLDVRDLKFTVATGPDLYFAFLARRLA
jgi:FkbM family methyltransferase